MSKNIRIIEPLSIGNTTNINMNVSNERSLERSLNITNTQRTNCMQKFLNNITTEVKIDQDLVSYLQAEAVNEIIIAYIDCPDGNINIGDIEMNANAKVKVNNSFINEKKVAIDNAVKNEVKTEISREGDMTALVDSAVNAQRGAMEAFLKGSEVDYAKLGAMARNAAAGAGGGGIGNTTNVNLDFKQSTEVDTALGITSEQINNSSTESQNTITNAIQSSSDMDISNAIKAENLLQIHNIFDKILYIGIYACILPNIFYI